MRVSHRGVRVVSVLALLFAGQVSISVVRSEDGGQATRGPEIVVNVAVAQEVVVTQPDGQEKIELRDVETAGPGDTLVYSITYTNKGTEPARNARIVDPVPSGTQLVPGAWQAKGAVLAVSIDGGKSFHPYPVRHSVTTENGKTVEQDVDPGLYTHLRWTATEPLPPSETRTATFKVKVR